MSSTPSPEFSSQSGNTNPLQRVARDTCPICSAVPAQRLPAPAPWELAWCASCHFGFLTNPPDYEALTTEFEWENSASEEKLRRHRAHGSVGAGIARMLGHLRAIYVRVAKRDKLRAVMTAAGMHGSIVDLGCGDGSAWVSFPANCTPLGIELSPVSIVKARHRLGDGAGRLIEADALNGLRQLPDNSVDGAIASSFVEHDVRPVETLRELHRVLRDGGSFVVKLPNYACWNRVVRGRRWCGFRFPDHVNYFTPRSLRELFTRNGFEVTRFGWLDRAPTSDNMWCVARKT